jgi:hypothetical protein
MEKARIIPQIQVRTQVRSGQGGGYVNGVWYADKSGVCGTGGFPPSDPVNPPTGPVNPPTWGGGYVGGVWYADRSGIC